MRRWLRLRTVLLLVNLLILLLPLGGVAALRLYENEQIRSTESQLIVQGAVVRETFRLAYREAAIEAGGLVAKEPERWGIPLPPPKLVAGYGEGEGQEDHGDLRPILPHLDVSREKVLPPARDAEIPRGEPDPLAHAAGLRLTPMLGEASRTTLAGIRVVDSRGIVVATSRSEVGLSLVTREEVGRALGGEAVSLLRQRISDDPVPPLRSLSRGQRYRVFVALPVTEGDRLLGAVVLSRTPLDISKALFLNRRPLIVGALSLLVVVILVSVLTSFTISRPLRTLTAQAECVAAGEREAVVPLKAPGTRELARLSEALVRMARTLEERAEYIRTFASHVSHEFKTPLTIIRGTTELLQDHLEGMTLEERSRFLENLDSSAARLETLVDRLFELARADALRPGAESCEPGRVLERVVAHYREAGLEIELRQDPGVRHLPMSADILEAVFSNLLDNTRKHGGVGVRVRLWSHLDESTRPPAFEVLISDDGPGISEANAERIFTPFFTTRRDEGGSGLGLSIVASLLDAHGGSIRLEPSERGATLALRIPTQGPAEE